MLPLFTYGALMYQPIWLNVVQQHCTPIPAVAQGLLRCAIENSNRCALITASPEARVSGMLYGGLTAEHIRALDAFAGEMFERQEVLVHTATEPMLAQAYKIKPEFKDCVQPFCWDQREFEQNAFAVSEEYAAVLMANQPSKQRASSYL